MTVLSTGMALVRQWFEGETPKRVRPHEGLTVELNATLEMARTGGDRIEASIAGRVHVHEPHGALPGAEDADEHHGPGPEPGLFRAETRVRASRRSSAPLADADPFVWLQLLDDRGTALTHETYLGRGLGIPYKVRARIKAPALVEPSMKVDSDDRVRAPRRFPSPTCLASGIHARVVTRTYGNRSGPRYHMEELVLMLLAAKAELRVPTNPHVPALALVPELPGVPARIALAGVH